MVSYIRYSYGNLGAAFNTETTLRELIGKPSRGRGLTPVVPTLKRLQKDQQELESSLGYTVSSRQPGLQTGTCLKTKPNPK